MFPLDFARGKRRRQDRWLAHELRQQGLAERPTFSPELHRRIWDSVVRQCPAEPPRAQALWPRGGALRWMVAAVVISACALGLALFLKQRGQRPGAGVSQPLAQPESSASPLPEPLELPRVARVAPEVEDLPALVDLAAVPRWAWLDHDARLTVETLAGQLPRDLAAAWSNAGPEKTP